MKPQDWPSYLGTASGVDVAAVVREELDSLPRGQTLTTTALVERLWPSEQRRGLVDVWVRKLFQHVANASNSRSMAAYVTVGPPTPGKGLMKGKTVQPKRWHAPDVFAHFTDSQLVAELERRGFTVL